MVTYATICCVKTPKASPDALKGLEDQYKSDKEAGRIVGPHGLLVWVEPQRIAAENAIRDQYKTVNMDLFNDYMQNASKSMKPEEPVNAQELYKTLDVVIQSVLTDKNADPKALPNPLQVIVIIINGIVRCGFCSHCDGGSPR